MKKKVVISCTNAVEAGVLNVAQNYLAALVDSPFIQDCHVIVFCYRRSLFSHIEHPNVLFSEIRYPKKNWVLRMFNEWVYFFFWSLTRKIDYWISLHDITPFVKATVQMVYFNQSAPFYTGKFGYSPDQIRMMLFQKFYLYLYRINLHRNTFVTVQQDWMRKEVATRLNFDVRHIIVAYPQHKIHNRQPEHEPALQVTKNDKIVTFVYVSFPRVYKNFEVIIEAVKELEHMHLAYEFKVILTFQGTENSYAQKIRSSYKGNKIDFIGVIPSQKVQSLYEQSDVLLFPSKLESWGLPLSEYRQLNKPILASKLPYAREALNGYDKVAFFDPDSALELKSRMVKLINKDISDLMKIDLAINQPHAQNWSDLVEIVHGTDAGR